MIDLPVAITFEEESFGGLPADTMDTRLDAHVDKVIWIRKEGESTTVNTEFRRASVDQPVPIARVITFERGEDGPVITHQGLTFVFADVVATALSDGLAHLAWLRKGESKTGKMDAEGNVYTYYYLSALRPEDEAKAKVALRTWKAGGALAAPQEEVAPL